MQAELELELPRFHGHIESFSGGALVTRYRPAYPPEFRRQMVEPVQSDRILEELSREFEPSA